MEHLDDLAGCALPCRAPRHSKSLEELTNIHRRTTQKNDACGITGLMLPCELGGGETEELRWHTRNPGHHLRGTMTKKRPSKLRLMALCIHCPRHSEALCRKSAISLERLAVFKNFLTSFSSPGPQASLQPLATPLCCQKTISGTISQDFIHHLQSVQSILE